MDRRLGAVLGSMQDFEVAPCDGHRRPELVRHVRQQSPLGLHRRVEAVEHGIEGPGELADLVGVTLLAEPLLERAGTDLIGRRRDPSDAAQQAPQEEERACDSHEEGDPRLAHREFQHPGPLRDELAQVGRRDVGADRLAARTDRRGDELHGRTADRAREGDRRWRGRDEPSLDGGVVKEDVRAARWCHDVPEPLDRDDGRVAGREGMRLEEPDRVGAEALRGGSADRPLLVLAQLAAEDPCRGVLVAGREAPDEREDDRAEDDGEDDGVQRREPTGGADAPVSFVRVAHRHAAAREIARCGPRADGVSCRPWAAGPAGRRRAPGPRRRVPDPCRLRHPPSGAA